MGFGDGWTPNPNSRGVVTRCWRLQISTQPLTVACESLFISLYTFYNITPTRTHTHTCTHTHSHTWGIEIAFSSAKNGKKWKKVNKKCTFYVLAAHSTRAQKS